MKSVPKPLLRMATAHLSANGNRPQSSGPRSTLPVLSSNSWGSSSSSASTPAEGCVSATSTPLVPRSNNNNLAYLQRNFGTRSYPPPSTFSGKLGALALLGGVMLFLGSAQTAHSFFFSSKASPASRMKDRLEKHGFTERQVIPDGNCQMRAISDQLLGDENHHRAVRSKIMSWLSTNEKFSVDDSGSTTLGDFIDREQFPKWTTYTSYMSRNGAWGDHITLLAAAEVYGVNISIISNVEDNGHDQYITCINPRSQKPSKTINLSHWHEMHYNSLYPVKQT